MEYIYEYFEEIVKPTVDDFLKDKTNIIIALICFLCTVLNLVKAPILILISAFTGIFIIFTGKDKK